MAPAGLNRCTTSSLVTGPSPFRNRHRPPKIAITEILSMTSHVTKGTAAVSLWPRHPCGIFARSLRKKGIQAVFRRREAELELAVGPKLAGRIDRDDCRAASSTPGRQSRIEPPAFMCISRRRAPTTASDASVITVEDARPKARPPAEHHSWRATASPSLSTPSLLPNTTEALHPGSRQPPAQSVGPAATPGLGKKIHPGTAAEVFPANCGLRDLSIAPNPPTSRLRAALHVPPPFAQLTAPTDTEARGGRGRHTNPTTDFRRPRHLLCHQPDRKTPDGRSPPHARISVPSAAQHRSASLPLSLQSPSRRPYATRCSVFLLTRRPFTRVSVTRFTPWLTAGAYAGWVRRQQTVGRRERWPGMRVCRPGQVVGDGSEPHQHAIRDPRSAIRDLRIRRNDKPKRFQISPMRAIWITRHAKV